MSLCIADIDRDADASSSGGTQPITRKWELQRTSSHVRQLAQSSSADDVPVSFCSRHDPEHVLGTVGLSKLCSQSKVFCGMLSEHATTLESRSKMVLIHASPAAVQLLVSFLQDGCPADRDYVSGVDCFEVWGLADMFKLKDIRQWLLRYALTGEVTAHVMSWLYHHRPLDFRIDHLVYLKLPAHSVDDYSTEMLQGMDRSFLIDILLRGNTRALGGLNQQVAQAQFRCIRRWVDANNCTEATEADNDLGQQLRREARFVVEHTDILRFLRGQFMWDEVIPSGIYKDGFYLNVHLWNGRRLELENVCFRDTVLSLKQRIAGLVSHLPVEGDVAAMNIFFERQMLAAESTLGSLGFVGGERVLFNCMTCMDW